MKYKSIVGKPVTTHCGKIESDVPAVRW